MSAFDSVFSYAKLQPLPLRVHADLTEGRVNTKNKTNDKKLVIVLDTPFRGPTDEFSKYLGDDDTVELIWVKPKEFDYVPSVAKHPQIAGSSSRLRHPHCQRRSADAVILPGSKRTVADLAALKSTGCAQRLIDFVKLGGVVVGVCGGYQILGSKLFDPLLEQGDAAEADGLGLLPLTTWFGPKMLNCQTQARLLVGTACGGITVGEERRSGYSLYGDLTGFSVLHVVERPRNFHQPCPAPCNLADGTRWAQGAETTDGLVSADQHVIGTYLHCVFENKPFVSWFLSILDAGDDATAVAATTKSSDRQTSACNTPHSRATSRSRGKRIHRAVRRGRRATTSLGSQHSPASVDSDSRSSCS